MTRYSLSHLTDSALLRDLATLVAQDRSTTAAMLAHLAEVDARKLHLPAGYPSMFAYCVGELRLSEDAAAKRIQAARLARRFPAILPALAEHRLELGQLGSGPSMVGVDLQCLLARLQRLVDAPDVGVLLVGTARLDLLHEPRHMLFVDGNLVRHLTTS